MLSSTNFRAGNSPNGKMEAAGKIRKNYCWGQFHLQLDLILSQVLGKSFFLWLTAFHVTDYEAIRTLQYVAILLSPHNDLAPYMGNHQFGGLKSALAVILYYWNNMIWLVVWNMNFIFPYIVNSNPN
jgi:hypothetical protein